MITLEDVERAVIIDSSFQNPYRLKVNVSVTGLKRWIKGTLQRKEGRIGSDYNNVVNWYHSYSFRSSWLGSMWGKTIFHIQSNSRTTLMPNKKSIVVLFLNMSFLWSMFSWNFIPKEKIKWTVSIIYLCHICLFLGRYLKC